MKILDANNAVVSGPELTGETFPGYVLRRALDPERGGSATFRMSYVTIEPGIGTPRHVHNHSDEAWYIVSGVGVFHAGGHTTAIRPHDLLFAQQGVIHQLVNTGGQILTYVAITSPPCDFERDNLIVEPFDPLSHTVVNRPRERQPTLFPSLDWFEALADEVNADLAFNQATELFDGALTLAVGSAKFWLKVFMGRVIRVLREPPSFGSTFSITGDEAAWHALLTSSRNNYRRLIAEGRFVVDGNTLEGMRMTKAVNILLETARRLFQEQQTCNVQ